jgi:hypothetical protein
MPNHLPIICQNLIIWKLLLSEQLEFWKARSLKNGYSFWRIILHNFWLNWFWNIKFSLQSRAIFQKHIDTKIFNFHLVVFEK